MATEMSVSAPEPSHCKLEAEKWFSTQEEHPTRKKKKLCF